MQAEDRSALTELLRGQRQAALGTLNDSAPFVSMVFYALDRDATGEVSALIHVSKLSLHTQHMERDPRVSLLVARPEHSGGNPQELARVTLAAAAEFVAGGSAEHARGKAAYIARLPESAFLFDFPDFRLVRLRLLEARYIGGFAKAFSLSAEQLQQVLGETV
jgi:hypothetical protein